MSCGHPRSASGRRLSHPTIDDNPVWNVLGSIISNVVAVAISLPFVLLFILVLPIYLSVKWLLLFIYCNRQDSNNASGPESVRGNDSRWLGTEWRSSVIHAVLVFEAKEGVNVDHFRRLLLKRVIPLYPRLTKRLIFLPILAGLGNCWMTDAKFSIDQHVFPGPSFLTDEKDLQEYVSKLVTDGLPEDKSPWQLQVFQSFGTNGDTIVILRIHQSVADGTALMRLLCHSLADSQIIEMPETPRFGSLTFCIDVFRACIVGPLTLFLWIFCSEEDCNLLTHRSTWTGSVTVTWSASITLPKVIRIKQVTRSTVNCVLLSALAGALRRLLQGCGVKQPSDVKVVVPMDLRDQTSNATVRTKLGNKTSSVIMPLPVAVEGCVPRLWATRKTLDTLKTSVDPVVLYVVTAALMSIGSASFARHLVNFFTDRASLQFSSIPGPMSEVLLGGQSLKGIYPILPAQANLGISITTITYADQVFVSVIAERALGPAAKLILQYLEDQIEVLWNLLLNRRVPGEQESPTLYMKTNTFDPPEEKIDARFSLVQKDVEHCNELRQKDKNERMNSLKAEFSELVNELKRRQSLSEEEARNVPKNFNQRILPCSICKRNNCNKNSHRQTGHCIESSSPTRFLEQTNLTEVSPAEEVGVPEDEYKTHRKDTPNRHKANDDCVIDISEYKKNSFRQGSSGSWTAVKKEMEEKCQASSQEDMTGCQDPETDTSDHKLKNKTEASGQSSDHKGPNQSNHDLIYQKLLKGALHVNRTEAFHQITANDPRANERSSEDPDESDIIGGVLI